MAPETRPILVTGAHRTGTTWVGKLLSADKHVAYISEPLNMLHRPGVFGAKVSRWYSYICRDNEGDYLAAFQDLLTYEYHVPAELGSLRSARDLLRMGRDMGIFFSGRLYRRRPLLKDPFAVFSLPWFADRLGCSIIVTVRHPAAFASSLKRLNWSFDFRDLLEQPLLMRDYLQPFGERMRTALLDDVIGQAGLLWEIIYVSVDAMRRRLPGIQVVRQEDLSLDPVGGFRMLYHDLGLDFNASAQRAVMDSSSPKNPAELAPGKVHSVNLDSRSSLKSWKRHISADEVDRVRRLTGDAAQLYYPEASWN